ncbi:NADP oxidoreductase coenzyme [Variovorax paradoxus]|uniref:NADP oxidoreductase coenzyme n=1 Tax=Variovorax paradoxus TaxID=34073 RepID=A0AA91DQU4_VARPD|nr:NAD(P)-binding domain-containing protein [Variovorax paradoxus]OAK64450.1 NADP oxidoreductase coenzyme [Variovorax paradoxus]
MTYSIIGAGNVGTALARQFARSGIAVNIANTRGVDSLAELAKELGDHVTPVVLEDALKAEVVILAVPFRSHASVAAALPDWSGKIVVDAMNTYGISPDELKGQASSHVVAAAFAGADVVKTFNQLPAKLLAMNPAAQGGRRVMFVAGDSQAASGAIAKLVDDLGFAALVLGKIADGGLLLGMGGPLILQNLIKY